MSHPAVLRPPAVIAAMPGWCVFSDAWLNDDKYCSWLARTGDKNRARCTLCLKDFDIGNMGEAALKSHMAGKKHIGLTGNKLGAGGQLTLKFPNSVKQAPPATAVSKAPLQVASESNHDSSSLTAMDHTLE